MARSASHFRRQLQLYLPSVDFVLITLSLPLALPQNIYPLLPTPPVNKSYFLISALRRSAGKLVSNGQLRRGRTVTIYSFL